MRLSKKTRLLLLFLSRKFRFPEKRRTRTRRSATVRRQRPYEKSPVSSVRFFNVRIILAGRHTTLTTVDPRISTRKG